ncbi:MAG TPA: hypothetical protein VGZ25_16380 [Gemmataceae bacterium]|jgi:hypothetical protein|nr:hypothetical protein [Gemmataceae bacterium]
MSDPIFSELRDLIEQTGPAKAIDRLCDWLKERKEFHSLFYALLMKKRQELGVSPIPTAPSQDMPLEAQTAFEEGIREAGRYVGDLCLEAGNIPQAWVFFRMLSEPGPVEKALDAYQPGSDEDVQPFVQIAFYEGVNPRKGIDLILSRYGLCNAITTMSSPELPLSTEARQFCIRRLVQTLYRELVERLSNDIERREGKRPTGKGESPTVSEIIEGRDWLFEDEFAHIDVSHLSSVVQMSTSLDRCQELDMARELCAYGQKLSPRLKFKSDPPFDNQYGDYGVYLAILAGDKVEHGIDHFRKKAQAADPDEVGTFPAEVLVNLLLRLHREKDALAIAREHLAKVENRQLSCPSIVELCQRANDYKTLAELAEQQADTVHFLAGMIAEKDAPTQHS